MYVWFGGLSEADLVGNYDPKSVICQQADSLFPVRSKEVLAVQKYYCSSVGGRRRFYIHISHPNILPLDVQREELHRVRILPVFHRDTERFRDGRYWYLCGSGCNREKKAGNKSGEKNTCFHNYPIEYLRFCTQSAENEEKRT